MMTITNSEPTAASTTLREGRLFGALVLAAFLLYGIGSSTADHPVGLALVLLNSLAVAVVGLLGYRLLRSSAVGVGSIYLGGRLAEAALLFGGIAIAEFGDVEGAANSGYLLGMIALGATSIPFFRELGRDGWISAKLATGGVVGYGLLAMGTLLELITGWAVAVVFAIPGGLFELALGMVLVRRGFRRVDAPVA